MNPFTNQGNQNNPYLQNAYAQQNFMANLPQDMQSMVNGFSPQKIETNTSASPQQQQFDPQTNATLMANLIAKRQMYGGQPQQPQQTFNNPVTSNPSIIGSPAAVSSMGMQSPQQQRQQSPMMNAQQMAQMQQQAYRNPQQQQPQQAYRNPQQQMAQMSRMDDQQRQQYMLMQQQQQLMRKQQQQVMVPSVSSTSTSSIPTSTMSPINPSNNIESPLSAMVGPSSNDVKSLAGDSDINTKRVEVVSLIRYIHKLLYSPLNIDLGNEHRADSFMY
jgi:hypothetical protein